MKHFKFLGLLLPLALAGCSVPSLPSPTPTKSVTHLDEWATVASVENVQESHRIHREEYICRQGAGVHVCSREKRIHQPAGVLVKLLRSKGATVSFFETQESPALVKGQTVCVEAIEGSFGFVVTAISPDSGSTPCDIAARPTLGQNSGG